ncbi:MFS sugar transporter (H(+)-myo-inositol Co-transporter) [Colletotrichum tofieldiae]|uniref:MFS sugar transporter (H(+)-myo-inositol Co-transporter) n=1 Tax=Colletotrichum tofieldiae TaxID=708197 RepID=A0A166YH52_9PEZI|nr:MFS sugar transporter (H(+)-myo-inositol Co-transporter) [Colletotrichum tofieldiae]
MERFTDLFHKPPPYVLASYGCSLGGLLLGIDTGIIGPVTVMESFNEPFGHPSPTVHGVIVSSILASAAVASFLAGHLADRLGRPAGIAIGSMLFGIGCAIEAGAVHLGMFMAGRVVAGIGEGFTSGIMIVYICEISPAKHRGALTTGPQLLICAGLLVGFFTCYGTERIESDLSWRLPFILLASYSVTFSTAAYLLLPASPRWLAHHGKPTHEVSAAWETLGIYGEDQEDMAEPFENAEAKASSSNIMDLFSPEARPRFSMAVFLLAMQQFCGIDGVMYYAPLLFRQAGIGLNGDTFLVSGILSIVICAVSIPGTIWADSWGRRANTIFGGLGMAGAMFIIGALYAADVVHATGPARWIVIVVIYIFTVIYCVSWGIVLKIYAAEIQPQQTRASATSIAHGANWLTNFTVALITPILLASSRYGAYFLFGGCTLLTAAICWFWMPETRGRTLSEIQRAFHANTSSDLESSGKSIKKTPQTASGVFVQEEETKQEKNYT